MITRDTIIAVGLGSLSGACILSLVTGQTGAMILSNLAPLPLFLAALSFGLPKAMVAVVAGSAATALLGAPVFMTYVVGLALPTLILARQALLFRPANNGEQRGQAPAEETPLVESGTAESGAAETGAADAGSVVWYPAERLILWLTGMAMAGYLAASLWYAGKPGGLSAVFVPDLLALLSHSPYAPHDTAGATGNNVRAATVLAAFIPAALAVIWQVMMAANGALAQGLAIRFGRNLRPAPDFAGLRLPSLLAVVLGAAALSGFLPFVGSVSGFTLTAILAVPYFFQGLAVVHAFAGGPMRGPMLVAFYLLLLLFSGLAVLVAAIGLIEQWAELRRRFAGLARP